MDARAARDTPQICRHASPPGVVTTERREKEGRSMNEDKSEKNEILTHG